MRQSEKQPEREEQSEGAALESQGEDHLQVLCIRTLRWRQHRLRQGQTGLTLTEMMFQIWGGGFSILTLEQMWIQEASSQSGWWHKRFGRFGVAQQVWGTRTGKSTWEELYEEYCAIVGHKKVYAELKVKELDQLHWWRTMTPDHQHYTETLTISEVRSSRPRESVVQPQTVVPYAFPFLRHGRFHQLRHWVCGSWSDEMAWTLGRKLESMHETSGHVETAVHVCKSSQYRI